MTPPKSVNPSDLTDARLQLHWASQVPSALGTTYAEPHPLWHHVALRWDAAHEAFVSAPAAGRDLRAGLRPRDLTLLLLEDGTVSDSLALAGLTFDHGVTWLEGRLTARGLEKPLQVRDPAKMPDHPVGHGVAFDADAAALADMAHRYAEAAALLEEWRGRMGDAGPVLVWAHHFDIALLRTVVAGSREDAEDAKTIGFGMTPGDGTYPEPYWYVTPWPYPEDPALPELPSGGQWHTQDWTGAVLLDGSLDPGMDDEAREAAIRRFLAVANAASENLIAA